MFLAIPLFTVIVAVGNAVPLPERAEELQLLLSLDREEYYENEPVFVDWAIVNGGAKNARLLNIELPGLIEIHVFDEKGEEIHLLGPPGDWRRGTRIAVLGVKEAKGYWLDLPAEYDGLRKLGDFRIQLVYDASCLKRSAEALRLGLWNGRVSSKLVPLRFVSPRGVDARAQAVIQKALAKLDPEDDEDARSHLVLYRNSRICDLIVRDSGSARFTAAALYYQAKLRLDKSVVARDDGERAKAVEEALRLLKACSECQGSSRYLKGIARYYLLACEDRKFQGSASERIRRLARELAKEYKDTGIASRSYELIDRLSDVGKP